ncbi:MAG TPA: hypothetical protein VFK20_05935, partial [Vicinamibacterales bacterium]|nr:hypothetical protein [Vicinamibacterales bacterium]
QIEILARERQPVDCVAASGGVVAMRPLTVPCVVESDHERTAARAAHRVRGGIGARLRHRIGHCLTGAEGDACEPLTRGAIITAATRMLSDLVSDLVSTIVGETIVEWIFPRPFPPEPPPIEGVWNASLGSLAAFLAGIAALFCGEASWGVLVGAPLAFLWPFLAGSVAVAVLSGFLARRALHVTHRRRALARIGLWVSRGTIAAGILAALVSASGIIAASR